MGVVYEAEQRDAGRPVALKVIRGGGYVSEQHVRLFQHETRTLALLRHPAIAALYEAGCTPEGQHYIVMELVRGEPLKEYVRARGGEGPVANREEVRWRLDLFLQVCHGMGYAHQRGVIHRDLKPNNILVSSRADTSEGSGSSSDPASRYAVKILDFGLARMISTDDSETVQLSEAGQIKGTLAYMSPEQARGNSHEIDIRSDIYTLGVILYELLTGRLPYEVNRSSLPESVRIICEQEPRRPGVFHKLLRGDLETIVAKTLEKDPARRYQTVNGLIEDIGRHLADQPILARPPSAAYQLRKLMIRHKAAFTFAVVLAVLATGFTGVATYMWQVARHERSRADNEKQRVEDINRGLRSQLDDIAARSETPPRSGDTPLRAFEPLGLNFAPPDPPQLDRSVPAASPAPPRAAQARTLSREARVGADVIAPERQSVVTPPDPAPAGPPPQASDPASPSVGGEVLAALLGQASFTDQEIYQAATQSAAAGIHILLHEYEQAEALLLSSYPIIMRASVSVEEKVAIVNRLIELYTAWGRPDDANRYRGVLAELRR